VFSALFRPAVLGIYVIFFSVGLVAALVLPSFSFFLAKEIGARPLLVGIAFAGLAIASIFYNYVIGIWSDKHKDRRSLVIACCFLGTIACLVFAFSRNYWLVVFTAVFMFSLSMVSFSQVMAYSLDYAEVHIPSERVPLFNAIMRAQIAFAWVSGPPLGFLLAAYYGFDVSYGTAAGLYLLIAVASYWLLPRVNVSAINVPTINRLHKKEIESSVIINNKSENSWTKSLIICAIAFSLLWGANNAYLIGMPLHLKDNLQFDAHWMGWLMGTTAGLEIPFMLLAGHYAMRWGLMNWIRAAGIAALILYVGIYFADALWQLFVLQLANAVFIGVLAGLGVSVFQELMPGRSGSASALYTNTTHIGNLFSSLMVGVVADYYGYQQVFLVNILIVVLAMILFGKIKSFSAITQ
jgi:MFS transporter, SET family, sugar efflux transporter